MEIDYANAKSRIDIEPVLVDAGGAAKMLGISRTLLYQINSDGRLGPKPIRLGNRCTRFVVAELKRWAESGCVSREQWLKEKAVRP